MSDTAAVQVTRHPPRVGGIGRPSDLRGALGTVLLLLAALPGLGAAESAPLDARVVWVRGPYAYVAARDSLAILPYSRLTFALKSKPVATAVVERSVDGAMVVARVTSGSLAGVKHLDRVRILVEPPDRPRLLRIGFPSANRAHLVFGYDSVTVATPRGYVLEGEAPSLRMIRSLDSPDVERWPDTLLVRTFDDPTDREIALERGELDVALFGPGEISSRMREFQHDVGGALAQGRMVCRPELLPYLRTLGPGAFASLLESIHFERRP